jgi:hypothetical protein
MTDRTADEPITAVRSTDTDGEIVQNKKDSPTPAAAGAAALDAKLTVEILHRVRALVRAHPHATLEQHVEIVLENIGGLPPDIPEMLRRIVHLGLEEMLLRAYELEEARNVKLKLRNSDARGAVVDGYEGLPAL